MASFPQVPFLQLRRSVLPRIGRLLFDLSRVLRDGRLRALAGYALARYRYHRYGLTRILGTVEEDDEAPLPVSADVQFSVLMPVYNPKPEWLAEAIESVLGQDYSNWQLCIVDDRSTDPAVGHVLRRYASLDHRILVHWRETNGHISAASNDALAMASGEFVVLLDHDDLLAKNALSRVAALCMQRPGLQLVYSDEDKIDSSGRRRDAYLKPGWDIELLRGQNVISHLGVYRTSLLRSVGGFRTGYEGAQDYDLALRCVEQLEAHEIAHIPHVLYHWRIHASSTAAGLDAKPYAQDAGARALVDHLNRLAIDAEVHVHRYGYRVAYACPPSPGLSVLLQPGRNTMCVEEWLRALDHTIEELGWNRCQVLLIGRRVESVRYHPRHLLLEAVENHEQALRHAVGELLLFIDAGLFGRDGSWLRELVAQAVRPEIGAVGGMLINPDYTVQSAGLWFVGDLQNIVTFAHQGVPVHCPGYFAHAALVRSVSAIPSTCLMIQSEKYQSTGGIDFSLGNSLLRDADFGLRVHEAGLKNLWTPNAKLFWKGSAMAAPAGVDASEVEQLRRRWGHAIEVEPALSPRLRPIIGTRRAS